GTIAFKERQLLKNMLGNYGKKRIVISVDHFDGNIMIEGWQKSTGKNLIEGIKDFIEMGFSEFLITNVNKDGTLQGPDLEFLHEACKINNINVISSGGISNIDDVIKVKQNNAYGVILGKALYENLVSIEEAKKIS
ncbi:MAG: HisA/HisF-related TIM barrel protein, partial [Nitrosopumilaceae archaeon]